MSNDIHTPHIPLFSEMGELQSYGIYIFGTDDLFEQHNDSFCLALSRYLCEVGVNQKMLSRLTGIASSTISRYLSGKRKIRYDYLCAVCIALRLHPCRQRHLFSLLRYSMPCEQNFSNHEEYIIRAYLDGCAFDERYTLTACNDQLKAASTKPFTSLISDKEDSE